MMLNNKQVPKLDQNVSNAEGASRSGAFPCFVFLVDQMSRRQHNMLCSISFSGQVRLVLVSSRNEKEENSS